jgi:hypothetical protein
MVSPLGVPPASDFNGLYCPADAKAPSDHKRQFPRLSSGRRPPQGAARKSPPNDKTKTPATLVTDCIEQHLPRHQLEILKVAEESERTLLRRHTALAMFNVGENETGLAE